MVLRRSAPGVRKVRRASVQVLCLLRHRQAGCTVLDVPGIVTVDVEADGRTPVA